MDWEFRATLVALLIAFVVHRAYYHRKFSCSNTDHNESNTPSVSQRAVTLLSVIAPLATGVYLIRPELMSWSSVPMPPSIRWAGLLLAAGGFLLLQWSHISLGKNWSDLPQADESHALVTAGPYRWIRHPIYTAFLLILAAPLFISANWFIGFTWILMTAIDVRHRINAEEALLLSRYGQEYRQYMTATGRLLPRFRRTPTT